MTLKKPLIITATTAILSNNSIAQWSKTDDFENGFTQGSSPAGINGWVSKQGLNDAAGNAIVTDDPLNSGRGITVRLDAPSSWAFSKTLPPQEQIAEGSTGTFFFEVFFPTNSPAPFNLNVGMSDDSIPTTFTNFESQIRFFGQDIFPRSGGNFIDTTYDFPIGTWLKVWMVIDNTNDTTNMYVQSPVGETSPTLVATDYDFRNGTTSPLISATFIQSSTNGNQSVYIDNVYVDPTSENLTDPVTLLSGDDYSLWASNFSGDLTDPNADLDSDGVSNNDERVFGTDPTNPASLHSLTAPFSPQNNSFTYTRRDPTLSQLKYSIWTSSDLQNWIEDTAATQTPLSITNDIQTVQTTLSAAVSTSPKIFIQIRTN